MNVISSPLAQFTAEGDEYTGEAREYLAGKGKGTYSVADIGSWRKYSCALEI
jgi:hypothetical protein